MEGRSLTRRLTERRSLRPPRRAECAFPSHYRPGDAGPNPPPACGALWRMPQLGKCARATPRQAAGRVARGPADLGLESGLTERRTLGESPSRKDAFWLRALTEKYTLYAGPHGKAHSARRTSRKGAVCVAARTQSALFRRAAPRLPR